MNALRKYLDKIKPNFEEGGKLHAFRSVFDGFETFLFVPNTTSKSGVNVHDAIDSKRIMICGYSVVTGFVVRYVQHRVSELCGRRSGRDILGNVRFRFVGRVA